MTTTAEESSSACGVDNEALSPAVLGTAAVVLRPLRFMFDVDANAAVISSGDELLGELHTHLRISRALPLIVRDESNGLLRAEQPTTSVDAYMTGNFESHNDQLDAEELSSLRGTFVWVLISVQLSSANQGSTLANARVQYQLSPATESFCLPLPHTNVVKLLVTDAFLAQIDTKTLQLHLLPPAPSPTSDCTDAKPTKPVERKETPRAESKDTTPSIIIAEVAFKKTQEEKERAEQELAAERLEVLQKNEENERLRQELLVRESQSEQLKLSNTMLEDQIGKQSAMLDSLKQSTGKADEALELLRQRMAGDAAERAELQRRLNTLEEEKAMFLQKSGACTLQ